jgi:hypothetical protein
MPPSPNGTNGRGPRGQFTTGNTFGKGNPLSQHYAAMRSAFVHALTVDDVSDIARKLIDRAKSGDISAIKLILAYGIGAPPNEPPELAGAKSELGIMRAQKCLAFEQLAQD